MPTLPTEDRFERSFRLACDVYDYCEDLVHLKGLPCRLAYQLFDAAGSVGANRAEARFAYSDNEFAVKNATCLKDLTFYFFYFILSSHADADHFCRNPMGTEQTAFG